MTNHDAAYKFNKSLFLQISNEICSFHPNWSNEPYVSCTYIFSNFRICSLLISSHLQHFGLHDNIPGHIDISISVRRIGFPFLRNFHFLRVFRFDFWFGHFEMGSRDERQNGEGYYGSLQGSQMYLLKSVLLIAFVVYCTLYLVNVNIKVVKIYRHALISYLKMYFIQGKGKAN